MSVNGYIISNHFDLLPEFLGEVLPKVMSGEVRYLEDIAEGLENAPRAFMNMLGGGNTGKRGEPQEGGNKQYLHVVKVVFGRDLINVLFLNDLD